MKKNLEHSKTEPKHSVPITEVVSEISDDVRENQTDNTSQESTKTENSISVCDVLKNHTTKVIKKMESQIPSNMQHYSDLYAEYLHFWDDVFGTCYISEKEFFDKLGYDQNIINDMDKFLNSYVKTINTQIDISSNLLKNYTALRIAGIKSFDSYVHVMMDSYANMLSQFNDSKFSNL